MTFDPILINGVWMVVGGIVSGTVVKVWTSRNGNNGNNHTIDTTIQLQTQILERQESTLKQIYDDSRGTHSKVKNTHERIGRMENIQACHGKEHDSHSTNLQTLQATCQQIPEKVRALLK